MENEEKTVETTVSAEETEKDTAPKTEKKKTTKAQITDLEAKLEAANNELSELRDQYQRMLAEYANYKRRTEQEKMQIGQYTKAELLTELLTSVDNMEKAIAAPAGEDYKTGVDLVLKQFMEALHKLGLTEIEAENAPFDPNVHNAVMREDADGVDPDTVTAVFQKGYKMGDRVLRPAMVKVAN